MWIVFFLENLSKFSKYHGGKMNIKIGADELIYHLRKNDKCKDIDDITLGNKIAKFFKVTFGEESFIQKDVPSYWCDNNHTINDYFKNKKLPLTSQLYEINIENICQVYKTIETWQ